MAHTSQSPVLSLKLCDRLWSFPALPLFVVSGIQAAAMLARWLESPHNPIERFDLISKQSVKPLARVTLCFLVPPLPLSLDSVPLTWLYYSSSLRLLSCCTGLKHWTAASGLPDVGCEPKSLIWYIWWSIVYKMLENSEKSTLLFSCPTSQKCFKLGLE